MYIMGSQPALMLLSCFTGLLTYLILGLWIFCVVSRSGLAGRLTLLAPLQPRMNRRYKCFMSPPVPEGDFLAIWYIQSSRPKSETVRRNHSMMRRMTA